LFGRLSNGGKVTVTLNSDNKVELEFIKEVVSI